MFSEKTWIRDHAGRYRNSTKFQIRRYFIHQCECQKHWRMFCLDKGKTVEDIIFDSLFDAQKYAEDKEDNIPEDFTTDFNVICQEDWYKIIHGEIGTSYYIKGEELNISWNTERRFPDDIVGIGAALNIQYHIVPLKTETFELQVFDQKNYTRLGRFISVSWAQDFAHKDYESRFKKD